MTSSTTPSPTVAVLELAGMHCGSCVALVEETLGERDGVEHVAVTLEPQRADVTFDPSVVELSELCDLVATLGYTAAPAGSPAGP